jgi:aspartokinase-like uncharacterized kinase
MSGTVVIKVGGSLFDWPDLPDRLSRLLEQRRAGGERLVLVAGGGAAADFVRQLDQTFALGDLPAHCLALRSLDLTAHVLAALVPGLVVVDRLTELEQAWRRSHSPALAPRRFLAESEPSSPTPLPASWDVTSDAIAARLAVCLGASELLLLKSAPLPPGTDRGRAAELGLVDRHFPEVARPLRRVIYRNLRGEPREMWALEP